MEAAGLAIGILSLYKATIDVLDRVDAYKKFGADSQISLIHFEAAKVRLHDWADKVGLRNGKLADSHSPFLDEPKRALIIQMALENLTKLLDEVEHTSSAFKLLTRRPTAKADLWPTPLEESGTKPRHDQTVSKRGRINWALGGREKLDRNITTLEGLVNVLYQVATPSDGGAGHWATTLFLEQENEAPFTASEAALRSTQESLVTLDRKDILEWLDAVKYDDEYEKIVSLHLKGTCEWIIKHPSFSEWENAQDSESGSRFLWIHGPAGFGKTVLSAWLIRYIREILKLPVVCCFSSSHAQRTEDFDSVVRTWITHLAQHSINVLAQCQIMRREHGGLRASRGVIWSLLKRVLSHFPSCVLALDGLDEFRDLNESRTRFLEDLKLAVASTRVKLLVTSRNEPDIEAQLSATATDPLKYTMFECTLTSQNVASDLGLYSQDVVAKKFPRQDDSYRDEISAQLADRADGMFLWIKLQQSQLRGSQNRKTIQRIVEGMPHGLEQTYERNWKGIQELSEPDRNRAVDILRWLTFGTRPLTVQELVEALVIGVDEDDEAFSEGDLPTVIDTEYINDEIKGLCRSFIDIRDGWQDTSPRSNTVHLAHASVREYLTTTLPAPLRIGPLLNHDATMIAHHASLASHCLRFLDHPGAWGMGNHGVHRSFTLYAVYSWIIHVQKSYVNHQEHDGVSGVLHHFLRSDNVYFRTWRLEYEREYVDVESKVDEVTHDGTDDIGNNEEVKAKAPEGNPSAIYYACCFELYPTIDILLNNDREDFNAVGGPLGTPLQVACWYGIEPIFERLMQRRADVTVQGGPFVTALKTAAFSGHKNMVKSLLEHGNPMAHPRCLVLDAAEAAASGGYLDIVDFLLDGGLLAWSDQEKIELISNVLYLSAENGHLTNVKLILDRGVDVNSCYQRNGLDWTPLHVAAARNHLDVMVELVERGANVALRDQTGYTPLHASAAYGYTEIAAYLLSQGADINTEIDTGLIIDNNALSVAASHNHLDVVRLLLDKYEELDMSIPEDSGAIHSAARKGSIDILTLLIQRGQNVNSKNHYGSTPLLFAVDGGHNAAAKLLLQHGADINTRDKNGSTLMHSIVYSLNRIEVQDSVNELLMDHGADPNISDNLGETPLFLAVRGGHNAAAEFLLQHGADATTRDKKGYTPMHTVFDLEYNVRDQKSLIKLLMDHGADPNIPNDFGETPLFLAVSDGHIAAAEFLLQHGANVNARDKDGSTPIHAVKYSNVDVDAEDQESLIRLLIDYGADPNIPDEIGETPLFSAIRYQNINAIRILTSKNDGALDVCSQYGRTPLLVAIDSGSEEVLRELLRQGANPSVVDKYGMTCLDWLKQVRPRLFGTELLRLHVGDVSNGRNLTKIKRKATERIRCIASELKDEGEPDTSFYSLCTVLLLLGMYVDALLAYQLNILAKGDNRVNRTFCDICDIDQTRDEPFYKCKLCPNTDFCQECMAKHKEKPLRDFCQNHDFLEAVASEARITPDQTEAIQAWLLGIEERLKADGLNVDTDGTFQTRTSASFDATSNSHEKLDAFSTMTSDANIHDVVNPITALAFVKDQSGDVLFLLAGEGPYLKIFDERTGQVTVIRRIFETQAVHGIICNDVSNDSSDVTELLIWGGRCVRLGLLRHGGADDFSLVEIELQPASTLEDWILACCFVPGLSLRNESEYSRLRAHDAVVLTAHNVAYAIRQHHDREPSLKQIVAGQDSMLYSGHIEWDKSGRILVASGTVFGGILVWSFAATAVKADAEQPVESQLHYSFADHEGSVFGVRISPDLSEQGSGDVRRLLASCSDDRTIRLWDISDLGTSESSTDQSHKSPSSTDCVAMIMGHASRIWEVRFLISGRGITVLSFGEDRTTQAWQLTRGQSRSSAYHTGELLLRHRHTYAYHSGKSIWASALVQRQNGTQTLCTGGADGRIVQYQLFDDERMTDGQTSTSKWTMQDITLQLGESQTSFDNRIAAAQSVPKKTICEHIFDELMGTWTIERTIQSALPTSPSGRFSGEAQFDSRAATAPDFDKEYLYVENGKFTTDQGLTFTATRRYVYRFHQAAGSISAWFVKPDDNTVVDYLFHKIRLDDSDKRTDGGLPTSGVIEASSYHLCVKDHYTPSYVWQLKHGHLHDWELIYGVKGPEKDYVAEAYYARDEDFLNSTNDPVSSTTTPAINTSSQARSDPGIEEDSLKGYVIMTDGSVLVTTAQGRVLVGSMQASTGSRSEVDNGDIDKTPTEWRLVGQYESLKSSSMVIQAVGSDLILLSGNNGTVFSYNGSANKMLPLMQLKRKLAFLYAQKVDVGLPESPIHYILAVCLGSPVAHFYTISDSDLRDNIGARQPIRLALPADFVVTSSCYLSQLRLWVLGSRNGALASYDGSSVRHDSELEQCRIFEDVHRQETVTVIQCLPIYDESQSSYLLTAGRDGHYAVHQITITSPRTLTEETTISLQTVHRSTPTFGYNIEGAAFDSQTQDLMLWGFRSKEFVVWNATRNMETMSVECGGAHRNWCYSPLSDGRNGGTFIWTKASVCNVHSQLEASHRVLSSGGHGREIKAMAISPNVVKLDGAMTQYIVTGAEDTTIKIWSYTVQKDESGSAFCCLGTFRKHTTGVQQLRWSPDGSLLFSAAGCEEFFVWRVQPVPFLGIGAMCEAVCPKVTDDGDLRVMDFAIAEDIASPNDDRDPKQKAYIVSIVYSDSSLRAYRYPSSHVETTFSLLASSTYTTHCLTAASYLSPNKSKSLCTASSDGHIAFWPVGGYLNHPSSNGLHLSSTAAVHQNSIKSMLIIPLNPVGLDCLIITGGDDGAVGITRRVQSEGSTGPVTTTLLIPKAHAAAVNAVEYLLGLPTNKSCWEHVFVSSGNDQRLKIWIIQVDRRDVPSNPIEGVAVRLHSDQYTSVADVSSLSAMTTATSPMSSLHPRLSESNTATAGVPLQRFSSDLVEACNACFADDRRRYTRVCAVFLYWENLKEDHPQFYECMMELRNLFEYQYNYTCRDIMLSPRRTPNDLRLEALGILLDICQRYSEPDTLLMFTMEAIQSRSPEERDMSLGPTPVHTEIHPNQQVSLVLAPLQTDSFGDPILSPSLNLPMLEEDEPEVQITVHLWDTSLSELQDWVRWFIVNRQPFVRELEITVASACETFVHGSGSLLVTLIMPAAVHNAMHGDAAYQMVCYVRSSNIWVPTGVPSSDPQPLKDLGIS
ncbi:MAG: hypothetical protein Q9169_001955 [Polycauliona sp. 2 TL-2023]